MNKNKIDTSMAARIGAMWTAFKAFATYRGVERSGCYRSDPAPRWFLPY